jgi:hypothetical protein
LTCHAYIVSSIFSLFPRECLFNLTRTILTKRRDENGGRSRHTFLPAIASGPSRHVATLAPRRRSRRTKPNQHSTMHRPFIESDTPQSAIDTIPPILQLVDVGVNIFL